jgi:hypothetical protein
VLKLPTAERWQLVQAVLNSLQQETGSQVKLRNLSRLRGIAKSANISNDPDYKEDYIAYLTQKYH